MNAPLTLRCDRLVCEITPQGDGFAAALWLDRLPVFQSAPAGVRQSVQGTAAPCRWRLTHSTQHAAHLACRHVADAVFPFDFEAWQAFELQSGALTMRLGVTNRSATPTPWGLAWRPYFFKREGSHLAFEATRQWDAPAITGLDSVRSSTGLNTRCAALGVERCYGGWPGELYLRDELVQVRLSSSLSCLVICSHPERDQIAIEPLYATTTSVSRGILNPDDCPVWGLHILSPGAMLAYEVQIEVASMP
jgi:aldose 1-epimerase